MMDDGHREAVCDGTGPGGFAGGLGSEPVIDVMGGDAQPGGGGEGEQCGRVRPARERAVDRCAGRREAAEREEVVDQGGQRSSDARRRPSGCFIAVTDFR